MKYAQPRDSKPTLRQLGLIGRDIEYSFSPAFFEEFFRERGLEHRYHYDLWSLATEEEVLTLLREKDFHGCNVTIPYKILAADTCDHLVGFAAKCQAVNTIRKIDGQLVGYNTDVFGILKTWSEVFFTQQLKSWNELDKKHVLIFGTGGASKAVQVACDHIGWPFQVVSRRENDKAESYDSLRQKSLQDFDILVNTTPLGSVAFLDKCVDIEINQISGKHFVFDLIYNPEKTLLLERAERQGARIANGQLMLRHQALLAWDIWNNS